MAISISSEPAKAQPTDERVKKTSPPHVDRRTRLLHPLVGRLRFCRLAGNADRHAGDSGIRRCGCGRVSIRRSSVSSTRATSWGAAWASMPRWWPSPRWRGRRSRPRSFRWRRGTGLFAINIPIGIAAVWLSMRFLPYNPVRLSDRRFDWRDGVMNALTFGLLIASVERVFRTGSIRASWPAARRRSAWWVISSCAASSGNPIRCCRSICCASRSFRSRFSRRSAASSSRRCWLWWRCRCSYRRSWVTATSRAGLLLHGVASRDRRRCPRGGAAGRRASRCRVCWVAWD